MDEKSLIDDLWPALEPGRDFSARVVAAMDGVGAVTPAPRARRRLAGALAVLVAVGVPFIVYRVTRPRGSSMASFGDVAARERQTVAIGDRAVAVAEPGAELGWTYGSGRVRVDQRRGTVFYRVERKTPFVVRTALGEVRVTGTCFQVELGEALAVHVFEGSVAVSNERGSLAVTAGELARVESGGAPALASGGDDREALARRERRVQQLERSLQEARRANGEVPAGTLPEDKYLNFSADDLKVLAARCEFRYARLEHLMGFASPDLGGKFALDDRERAAVAQIMEDQRTHFIEELRSIYVEIVGDPAVAAKLSPTALVDEINSKSRPGEDVEARDRLFAEWAGRTQPPANVATRPPVERFWRLVSGASESFVKRVGDVVGPERARQIAKSTLHDAVVIRGPCGRFAH